MEQKIKELYGQGWKIKDISRECKIGNEKTIRILTELGIKKTKAEVMRKNKGVESVRSDAFDILTPDALYWIGFLYADGCIESTRPRLCVDASEVDIEHLRKFGKFLGGLEPREVSKKCSNFSLPGQSSQAKQFRVSVSDKQLYSKLVVLGFTSAKSYDAVPHPLLENSRDFWRGVVDGDGWICKSGCKYNMNTIGLSGTEPTLISFIRFINLSGIICGSSPRKDKRSEVYKLDIHSQIATKVVELLYKNSTIYLDRKYEKYQSFFL